MMYFDIRCNLNFLEPFCSVAPALVVQVNSDVGTSLHWLTFTDSPSLTVVLLSLVASCCRSLASRCFYLLGLEPPTNIWYQQVVLQGTMQECTYSRGLTTQHSELPYTRRRALFTVMEDWSATIAAQPPPPPLPSPPPPTVLLHLWWTKLI